LSDIISGIVLGLFGPLHLALGLNCLLVVFHWSFYWKLGYILMLWMTYYGFRLKVIT